MYSVFVALVLIGTLVGGVGLILMFASAAEYRDEARRDQYGDIGCSLCLLFIVCIIAAGILRCFIEHDIFWFLYR